MSLVPDELNTNPFCATRKQSAEMACFLSWIFLAIQAHRLFYDNPTILQAIITENILLTEITGDIL
jgi:hypothetical protein